MLQFQAPAELLRQVTNHPLHQIRHLLKVRKRPIRFQHRELRIVPATQSLVPEIPVQLKNPREPTHQQPLQKQLRRDPQIQRHPQRIVKRLKRCRRRTARHILHHRRLHLQEIPLGQIRPNLRHHPAPCHKHFPAPLVRKQIQIPLPILDLPVRHPMPLVRQWPQRLAQKHQLLRMNRVLPRLRHKRLPDHSNEVPNIHLLDKHLPHLIPHFLLVDVNLDPTADVSNVKKGRLTHLTARKNTTRHPHGQSLFKGCLQRTRIMRNLKLPSKCRHPTTLQRLQFVPAHLQEFGFGGLRLILRLHEGSND